MQPYQKLDKHLDAVLTKLNTIKASEEWLALMQEPAAHPDLLTDFVTCLRSARDLKNHIDSSVHSIRQTTDNQHHLRKEIQEEAA